MGAFVCIPVCMILFLVGFSNLLAFELRSEALLLPCNATLSKNHTIHKIIHNVENCDHKIRISLTIKNEEKSPTELKFNYIKDVLEVESGHKLSLLNPIVIRFRQEQVLLGYPIKYLTAVNGRASEKVSNYENQKNFTGCDDESSVNPTCGLQHQKGVAVEYSQGFCCFCPETLKGKQVRGGQDCSLAKSPSQEIDLQFYKASAHCLVKDKLWFTVNALDEPLILHQVFMQVYNLKHLRNGSSLWFALTGDDDYTIGSNNPFQYDENKTIVITYVTAKPSESSITVPFKKIRLLVPQPIFDVSQEDLPAISKNGPGDYMLLPKEVIHSEGDTCNKAGVSYEGFSLQSDRCDSPKNSCLKNQPLDFWEKDTEKIKGGGKGTYLLKNFGKPYKDAIIINKETKEHWLALEYYKQHKNLIHIEIKADDIVALTIGKHGIILMVMTESTSELITFNVDVQNSGLASAEYTVRVTDCEYSVPDSKALSKVIAPQHNSHIIVQAKPGNIQLAEKFKCTVELNTTLYKVISKREVTVKPKGRCVCNFHCLCACLGESLTCYPMTEKDYHLAGFRGSLPILTAKPHHKPWILEHPVTALCALVLFLLLIGFIKSGLGLLNFESVGEFGLYNLLYKPEKLDHYPDPVLEDVEVLYDDDGYPIHPDTNERVKLFSHQLLFALNCFFCFVWPIQLCRDQMLKQHQKSLSEDAIKEPSEDTENIENVASEGHVSEFGMDSEAVIDVTASETTEQEEEEENQDLAAIFKTKVDKLNRVI